MGYNGENNDRLNNNLYVNDDRSDVRRGINMSEKANKIKEDNGD